MKSDTRAYHQVVVGVGGAYPWEARDRSESTRGYGAARRGTGVRVPPARF